MTTDRVAALVAGLTLDEKAALTAGADLWHTAAVPRLGIPAVRLTDGPNGARGAEMGPAGPTSTCLPCGSALGATWSPEVVGAVGGVIRPRPGPRAPGSCWPPPSTCTGRRWPGATSSATRRTRCCPPAGRRLRAGRRPRVATTVKHLVGNDAETERYTMSSDVDERACGRSTCGPSSWR